MKNQIDNILTKWFDEMLKKYTDVSFKYEYNEKRHVYLISYTINGDECQEASFFEDIMAFEDRMDLLFENDAPLFCENESLFQLSDKANLKSNTSFNNAVETILMWQTAPEFYYNYNSDNILKAA